MKSIQSPNQSSGSAGADGPGDSHRSAGFILGIVGLAYGILLIAGWLWPATALWGVHFLAFFPAPVSIGLIVVAILLSLPPLSERYVALAERIADRMRIPGTKKFVLPAVGGILAAALFLFARIAINMYGDEKTLLTVLGEKIYSVDSLFRLEDYAPLTRLVHQQLASLTGLAQRTAIMATSIVAGGITVAMLIRFVHSLDGPRLWKFFALLLVLGCGTTELFCGYIEDYTLVYSFVLLFLMAGWNVLEGKPGFGRMILIFLIGVACHIQMVLLAPALAYAAVAVLGRRNRRFELWTKPGRLLPAVGVSLVGAAFAYFYIFHASSFSGMTDEERIAKIFLPLDNYLPPPHSYTLLSAVHFGDLAQEILLVVAPGAVLAFALVGVSSRRRRWSDTKIIFFLLCAFYLLLFDCTVNPLLTMMRDWDFLSLVSAPLAFLGIVLSREWFMGTSGAVIGHRLTGLALGLLIVPAGFIAVNACPEEGSARLRSIGEWAYRSYYIGSSYIINMGCISMADMPAQAAERAAILRRIVHEASADDMEIAFLNYKCGVAFHESREYEKAIPYFTKSLDAAPDNASSMIAIGLDELLLGDYGRAAAVIGPVRQAMEAGQIADPVMKEIASDIARANELAQHDPGSPELRAIVATERLRHLK